MVSQTYGFLSGVSAIRAHKLMSLEVKWVSKNPFLCEGIWVQEIVVKWSWLIESAINPDRQLMLAIQGTECVGNINDPADLFLKTVQPRSICACWPVWPNFCDSRLHSSWSNGLQCGHSYYFVHFRIPQQKFVEPKLVCVVWIHIACFKPLLAISYWGAPPLMCSIFESRRLNILMVTNNEMFPIIEDVNVFHG